jgi:DNA-binding winged helix-turn-helix (wHTH) protein
MTDMSVAEPVSAIRPHAGIYLEKGIFFDQRGGQLVSAADTVALNFRESLLLQLLLTDRVRKQAVIAAAWGDNGAIVTEASYHQLIRSLRKKFEEIGLSAQSIKTLPRFGLEYLRELPVSEPDPTPPVVATLACPPDAGAEAPALPESGPAHRAAARRWKPFFLGAPLLICICAVLAAYRGGRARATVESSDVLPDRLCAE